MKRNDNRTVIIDTSEVVTITTPEAEGLTETSFIVDNLGNILVDNTGNTIIVG